MKKNRAKKSIYGTSLIELLVVIVVFLIGILSIAQIFPGGLRILATTRAETMATAMAHGEMDFLRANAGSLPKEIVPVAYTVSGGNLTPNFIDQSLTEFGPQGGGGIMASTAGRPAAWNALGNTWDAFDTTGDDLGPWQLLSGANNVRHVIDEGKTVPAPRPVGANYGCLVSLLFAPIVEGYSNDLLIYGNDLQKTEGPPAGSVVTSADLPDSAPNTGDYLIPSYGTTTYQYYLDDQTSLTDPVLYIPEDSNEKAGPNVGHSYRISAIAYYTTGAGIQQQSYVLTLSVPAIPAAIQGTIGNGQGCYYIQHLSAFLGLGGSLVSVNYGSVLVEREFDPISATNPLDLSTNPDGTPHNPYQYELLNPSLGQVLINPLAYGYVEESQNGQPVSLVARADYDVYDWRILHEDFRLPDYSPYSYQLHVSNLKHVNGYEADLTYTSGINTGLGVGSPVSVMVVDQNTGGIFTTSSFSVDYHNGIITFKPNPSSWSEIVNTLSAQGAITGTTTISPNPGNLSLRVYYMANGEWACQVLKSSSSYIQAPTLAAALIPGEFYVQQPATGTASGTTAIQFCRADIGQTVSFEELWYQWADGSVHCARGQSAVVKVIGGVPLATATDIDPMATTLDFSNGYAVKGVKGLSVSVRVLWNPNTVKFQGSSNNLNTFSQYLAGWRNTTTDAVLDKEMVQK